MYMQSLARRLQKDTVRIYELYDVQHMSSYEWSTDSLGSVANFREMFLGHLPYIEYLGTIIHIHVLYFSEMNPFIS